MEFAGEGHLYEDLRRQALQLTSAARETTMSADRCLTMPDSKDRGRSLRAAATFAWIKVAGIFSIDDVLAMISQVPA